MKKGVFGFHLWFYPALAMVLAMLGQTLLCALVFGFALLVEKDEWVSMQTLQALLLSLFSSVVGLVVDLAGVFSYLPFVGRMLGIALDILDTFIGLLVVIFALIGLLNVCKGKEAGVPIAASLADKIYGRVKAQPVYQTYQQPYQQPYQGYQPPQQQGQSPYQAPPAGYQPPVPPQPVNPQPSAGEQPPQSSEEPRQ